MMPSPFPGMDPYLEHPGWWPDFHATFITNLCYAIRRLLPKHYAVRIETNLRMIDVEGDDSEQFRPDLSVTQRRSPVSAPGSRSDPPSLEPVIMEMKPETLEVRERRITVQQLPTRSVVTVVEMLSP